MGKAAYIITTTLLRKGDYNEASQYSDLSIKYYLESGNETGMANCYVASARINQRRGNFQQSVKDNYAALRIYEKTGNKVGMYNVHTGLGIIYLDQKNYTEALNSYQAAKKYAREQDNKEVLANAYINVGNTYMEMGNTPEALKAFEEALNLAEQAGSKKSIASAQGNLGIIYSKTGRTTEAIKSYEQTIKLYEQLGAKEGISIGYLEIGKVYFNTKQPDLGKEWLNKALQIAKEIDYKDVISQSYLLLMQIDTSKGDYISALEHHKLHITYRDSIANAEAAKHLIEQRMQYAFSKKEDSLRLQQALIAEKLEKQTLLTKQQQQELLLKQSSLELAQREKDLQMLRFLKTQAELQLSNEQKEKKLTLAEQERALQQSQLEKQTLQNEQTLLLKDKQLTAQRSQRNFWLAGAIALFLLSFFIFRNNRNQRKANARLQQQQAKTEQALKELKSTQAQLIQSEKMASLGELTAGIAHEIQNPLNFVNNFSELNDEMLDEMKHELQSGKFEDAFAAAEVIKENNSKINHHGKRADAIVKGMLQHSRAGSRKKESIDINTLADEYLRLSYHGLRAKDKDFNANFTSDFDKSIGRIEVVPQDIGRVLLNLYNNAFYAVNEKKKELYGTFEPTVSVTTKKLRDKVEISVRDNGTGIPQKALDKIYQPFFTTKPTGQGTGLGLSLSYDIIKAHGGELKVETKEGEGAEFMIFLPLKSLII
jgi:signal transduction histidine kinase/tetratricopeptide (TPR) repeat protein